MDTVESFRGQERDGGVASFGLDDPDLIPAEDKFLYNLNRFNVMAPERRPSLSYSPRVRSSTISLTSILLKNVGESFCHDPGTRALRAKSEPHERQVVLGSLGPPREADRCTSTPLYSHGAGAVTVFVGRGQRGTGLTGPVGNDRLTRGATNRVERAEGVALSWAFDDPRHG